MKVANWQVKLELKFQLCHIPPACPKINNLMTHVAKEEYHNSPTGCWEDSIQKRKMKTRWLYFLGFCPISLLTFSEEILNSYMYSLSHLTLSSTVLLSFPLHHCPSAAFIKVIDVFHSQIHGHFSVLILFDS